MNAMAGDFFEFHFKTFELFFIITYYYQPVNCHLKFSLSLNDLLNLIYF